MRLYALLSLCHAKVQTAHANYMYLIPIDNQICAKGLNYLQFAHHLSAWDRRKTLKLLECVCYCTLFCVVTSLRSVRCPLSPLSA